MSDEISKALMQYAKLASHINLPLPHENWNPLQFACAIGDVESVKYLIDSKAAETDNISGGRVAPRMTPVHICALYGHVDILVILVTATNADIQDQWGFTALHYAVSNRKIQAVQFLLDFGANASLTSSAGSTPLQIAQELGYHEIADILASKVSITEAAELPLFLTDADDADPAAPQFREWLRSLGAGAYISSFFKAGYDLAFVAAHGLSDEDCDCVGIPTSQMGLRRKLKTLHKIELFVPVGGKKEIDGEDGESSDEGDSADENSEGGDSDAS